MKETITAAASQTKRLGSYLSPEGSSDQSVLMRTVLWIWRLLLLKNADRPAHCQVAKRKRPRWYLVNVVLCLSLVGPILAVPFMELQTTWAAPDHLAHQHSVAAHLTPQRPASTTYAHDNPLTCPSAGSDSTPTPDANGICTYTPHGRTCANGYVSNGGRSIVCTSTANGITCPSAGSDPTPTPLISNDKATCTYTPSGSTCAAGYVLSRTGRGGAIRSCTAAANFPPGSSSSSSSSSSTCIRATNCGSSCASFLPGSACDLADALDQFVDLIKELFEIVGALLKFNFAGWILCILTAGTVQCPTLSNVAPWAFDCPVSMAGFTSTAATSPGVKAVAGIGGTIAGILGGSLFGGLLGAIVGGAAGGAVGDAAATHPGKQLTIYQTALQSANNQSATDWLSGDSNPGDTSASSLASEPGHLIYTYAADTYFLQGMPKLTSISMGLGVLMIGPLFVLVGLQFLLASVRPGQAVANAMEGFGRVLLAGAIVGLSYYVVQMLFTFLNTANSAVVALHQNLGYPQTTIDGQSAVSYSVPGDTSQSFRGLVIPMDLWGCVIDDFLGLMASRVANAIGSGIPIIGGIFGITGRITEIGALINDIGEFLLLVLSVTIWGQAIARIVLINYYIIMAPVAFACWGLPGPLGNQVIRAWFKGFLQLLFMQTVQIFILTTIPSLLPDFGLMHFPVGGSISNPPLQSLLVQLPPIITAAGAVGAPKILMGMGPMRTVAQAGAIAGKAVAATGIAISGMIKKK